MSVVLPSDIAKTHMARQQAEAMLKQLHTNIATSLYGHLLEIEYAHAIAKVRDEQSLYGEGHEANIQVALGRPANVAIQAAAGLLKSLGYPIEILGYQAGDPDEPAGQAPQ